MSRRGSTFVLAGLLAGCGCKPDPGGPGAASPPSVAVAGGSGAAPGSPPTASRWLRTPPSEPDPAAKGLYRRMIDRAAAGDATAAAALAEQIRREYPDSRFAVRLSGEASPAGVLGAVLMFGAVVVPFVKAGADRPPTPGGAAPATPGTP